MTLLPSSQNTSSYSQQHYNNQHQHQQQQQSYPGILTSSQSASLSPLHKKKKLLIDPKQLDGHNFNSLIKHMSNTSELQHQQVDNRNNNKRIYVINNKNTGSSSGNKKQQ